MSGLIAMAVGMGYVAMGKVGLGLSRRLDAFISRGKTPDLYPELDDAALCQVFDAEQAKSLHAARRLFVLAFAGDSPEASHAGRALSELLRRDLCLVRGLATYGSEDTRDEAYAEPDKLDGLTERGDWILGGSVKTQGDSLELTVWLVHAEHKLEPKHFRGSDPALLLRQVVDHLAQALGAGLDPISEAGLALGRPSSMRSLFRLGAILEAASQRRTSSKADEDLEIEALALDLLADEPQLSVLAPHLGKERFASVLALYERDPYNAGLCFQLYLHLWRDRGFQREAVQFVRRGLLLCPAHGKLNMVLPHASLNPASMGQHAELGYRLLPHNSFAASNYAYWLATHARDHRKVVEVSRAAIDLAPHDPANYHALMDAYQSLDDFERALEVGKELMGYLEPRIHPRTRYCLYQNPATRERMESGQYDPAASLSAQLNALEKRAERRWRPKSDKPA